MSLIAPVMGILVYGNLIGYPLALYLLWESRFSVLLMSLLFVDGLFFLFNLLVFVVLKLGAGPAPS
jgi:hypothetical protein